MSIVLNYFSIVAGEAQKASDILTVVRLKPIHYHTALVFLGMDSILPNLKVATVDVLRSPGVFCMFGLDNIFRLQDKDFSDIYDTFRQSTAVNHTIVKVYDDEFAFHSYHDAIQHAHELAWCVCQANLQKSPLV